MRYNRFGFMSNKFNSGNLTPFPSPNINVSQTTNSTAVTYTITSDITHISNLAYSMTGTAVASDFSDSALSGNIALTGGNATLVKQIVLGNSSDPTFAVQLRDTANGSIFYEGNTFQVTTLGEPNVSTYNSSNVFANILTVGYGVYSNTNVTIVRINPVIAGNTQMYDGFIRFDSLGSANGNMDVLIVGSGGGAGERYNNPYTENYRSAGGGGGGEHTVQTIAFNTISVGTNYAYTIGYRGQGAESGPGETGFTLGKDGNTSTAFSVTVAGGTGGKGNVQPATGNSAGLGGSTSHTAGGNGGNGSRVNDANSDGQNGQVGTTVDQWLPFANNTVANVSIGSGGGSANSEVGAAPSTYSTQFGRMGVGGSAIGGAGDVGNTFFKTEGIRPDPAVADGDTTYDQGDGEDGTIQLRWPTVASSRTIAIT